jgi:hypothetical protein
MAEATIVHFQDPSSRLSIQALSAQDKIVLDQRLCLIQSWVNEFAAALGKRRPPTLRLAGSYIHYIPFSNELVVPVRAALELEANPLRLAIAHECGHFGRRWKCLGARSEIARLWEEVAADQIAATLTGADDADLEATIRSIVMLEGDFDGDDLDTYMEMRLQMLRQMIGTTRRGGSSLLARSPFVTGLDVVVGIGINAILWICGQFRRRETNSRPAALMLAMALGLCTLTALPARADPCNAILCLGGLLEGTSGGPACAALTADYFAIQIWSPLFNPPATAAARQAYLSSCPAGPETPPVIAAITATFGPQLTGPSF